MRLTYNEVIAQALRRLGRDGFDNSLRSDIQFAVSWAEDEIMRVIGTVMQSQTFPIISTQAEYGILTDFKLDNFARPCVIIVYDSNDNPLAVEEVDYSQWLEWNPLNTVAANDTISDYASNPDVVPIQARLTNKIVFALHYVAGVAGEDSQYVLSIKPAIDGTVLMNYTVLPTSDVFDDVNRYSIIPEEYHKYLVAGVTYYLGQIEQARFLGTGDVQKYQIITGITLRAKQEFQECKIRAIESSKTEVKPAIARPYAWYENLRRYTRLGRGG